MYFQKREGEEGEDESEYAEIYGLYLAVLSIYVCVCVCVNRLQFMDYTSLYDTFTCECVLQLYRLKIFDFYFYHIYCAGGCPQGRERVNRLQFMDYIWLYYASVRVCLDAR